MKKLILSLLVLLPFLSMGQQKENKVKIKIGGFVSAETFMDSRKTVNSREGDVLLWPAAKDLDANGDDINGDPEFFMTAIHSRLNVGISGFEAFGAQGSAAIQGDFVGTSTARTGLFRLRHAFIKLDWGKDELLAGKYWHPMFVLPCNPHILHWGGGIPVNVLGRAPQMRYTRQLGGKSYFLIAALSQLDFASPGPDGASSKYVQQSAIPEITGQICWNATKGFTMGATAGFKSLKPHLVNANGLKSSERLGSYHMNAWMTLKSDKLAWSVQSIYGQNMSNFVMLGGYGVKNVKANGDYEYTNIKTGSLWTDLYKPTGNVRYGLYAGYTKNMGADDDLIMEDGKYVMWSRGGNIDHVYQVAPRLEFHSGKMMVGTSIIYTAAAYGTTLASGKVDNAKEVGNTRLTLHLKYSF